MAFDTPDPCEAICAALAAAYNAHTEFSMQANATLPDDPQTALDAECLGPEVTVYPFSEQFKKTGRGKERLETFNCSLMFRCPAESKYPRAKFLAWVREVVAHLFGDKMAGYVFSEAETVSKFNVEQRHQHKRWVSIVRLSYLGTAH